MPPRKTPPARISDKPKITGLNLDKLTREGAPEEPYVAVLDGRPYTFKDPMEDPWQSQVRIDPNNAVQVLKSLLSDDDWESFKKVRLETWKLVALARDIHAYYGLDPEAEGNGAASPGF